ncbi:hypothetical protein PR202_ga23261 [Eleusine coracana subsp. coracana]|uniref:Glycosyltransferase n=1 Tax=Eleusine coracana subsp. coracana TaxID=191504 RepID=A0AAV5D5T2_ELECO|nr:hypothetical protein QOZ80_1AG0012130 [Eleusine coracana subsp. coracana]GJN05614.1 hypothetical protein PR202_ga23261 [Eleusine coracana subsp. coracana]
MPAMDEIEEPHFLIVTYPAQGHINPARHLARRLLRATGARVTVSTAVSGYRKMFPGAAADGEGHVDGAGVRYVPYSDGYDGGFDLALHDHADYMTQVKVVGSATLAGVLARLRDAGRPVTLVVYTLLLSWVADVARDHGVPAALYWIQPATVLAVYLHFFRGTGGVGRAIKAAGGDSWAPIAVPGLPPLKLRDLPSFITSTSEDDPYAFVLDAFRDLIDKLTCGEDESDSRPVVLANTFDAMEPEAVATLRDHGINVVPVGPVLSFLEDDAAGDAAAAEKNSGNDLFEQDGKGYLEWLDAQVEGSVVYVSFGSLSTMSERQIQEIARGMEGSGRPFLWVLRRDNRTSSESLSLGLDGGGEKKKKKKGVGVVVEWCDQVRVLSHRAVGCFVTHCGWNSTLESVACGVPVVCVPQWTDQGTNAWIVAERLGTGVRAAVSEKDGVIEADELRRCVDFATSEMVRAKAALWRNKARAAAAEGGSSERNLRAFVGNLLAGGEY